jgi:hypothetical protein
VRVRHALERRPSGLTGPRAVQQEIRQARLLRPVPSLATLKRWLQQAGASSAVQPAPAPVHYPAPEFTSSCVLPAMEWTARYLEGGAKVFAFHTVD